MQSDPWWSFAMAVNVYMVFFFAANPNSFLGYWWAYFCICYGIPFIPAVWLLVARGEDRTQVYGNATVCGPHSRPQEPLQANLVAVMVLD